MFHVTSPTFTTIQARVIAWYRDCFPEKAAELKTSKNRKHVNHRFLEEAVELVQACDCTEAEALEVVRYVYSRSVGERKQEVGGVSISLAVLCETWDLQLVDAAESELARIKTKIETIRGKEAAKPNF